jgi:methylthioribose-1-phosphate isomerase
MYIMEMSRINVNRIGGVMISVLASSAVDRWFVASPLSTPH